MPRNVDPSSRFAATPRVGPAIRLRRVRYALYLGLLGAWLAAGCDAAADSTLDGRTATDPDAPDGSTEDQHDEGDSAWIGLEIVVPEHAVAHAAIELAGTVRADAPPIEEAWWDFDVDAGISRDAVGLTASARYRVPGTYTVRLTVVGLEGQTAAVERQLEIEPDVTPPVAEFSVTGQLIAGEPVAFDADGSSDDARIVAYAWDFDASDGPYFDGDGVATTHVYREPGTYIATLTVMDGAGNEDTAVAELSIEPLRDTTAPQAEAGPDELAHLGAPISLDGTRSSDNVGIDAWSWSSPSSDVQLDSAESPYPTVTGHVLGDHTIELAVRDAAGNVSTDHLLLTIVEDEIPPIARIRVPERAAARTWVTLDGSASTDDVRIAGGTWTLEGPDGAYVEVDGLVVRHSFAAPGRWSVTLRVSDGAAAADEATALVEVDPAEPVRYFASPDRLQLAPGERRPVRLLARYEDGSTTEVGASGLRSSDTSVAAGHGAAVEAVAPGTTDVALCVGERDAARLQVVVGANVVAKHADGALDALLSDRELRWRGDLAPSLDRGQDLIATQWLDGALFLVLAEADCLNVYRSAVAGAEVAEAFEAAVPAAIAATPRSADEWFVVVEDGTLWRVTPDGATPLASGNSEGDRSIGALSIAGELVWWTTSAEDGTSHLHAWDAADGAQRSLGDDETAVRLPAECARPASVHAWDADLWISCLGNEAAPATVVRFDPRRATVRGTVPVPGGPADDVAVDPFGELVYYVSGSVDGPTIAVADLVDGTSYGELVAHPDSAEALVVAPEGSAPLVGSAAQLYRVDRDAETRPLLVSLGALDAAIVDLHDATPFRQPIPLSSSFARVRASHDGGRFGDTTAIYGLPRGRGLRAQNATPGELYTVSDDGWLEVELVGRAIVDGPGPDLAIYENAFCAGTDPHNCWIEPARVQLSEDLVSWVDVPTQRDTRWAAVPSDRRGWVAGFVGIQPVFVNPDASSIPLGSTQGGGDRFDLADVGLSAARGIRVVDIASDGRTADIDAIGLIHWTTD